MRFTIITILLTLTLTVRSLNLASRCLSSFDPGECPCSRRQSSSPDFCLTSATATTCRQRTCSYHYICDCAGDTLCRTTPIRTSLTCLSSVSADGVCACQRSPIRTAAFATQLIPLREHRPLHPVRAVMPRNKLFCTERPPFWSKSPAERLLRKHWHIASQRHREAPVPSLPLVRFGHPGHAVSFTSPQAIAAGLSRVEPLSAVEGDILDPVNHPALNHMTVECVAALLSIRLASQGIATRKNAAVVPFNMFSRMVLQPCPYLPKSNPAVGMSLERVMELAMLATGRFPLDDATLSHANVAQACSAINRNFEACQVDVGCLAITT